MFDQNRQNTFVLYYLICIWIKFHINIMRFMQFGAHQTQKYFAKNYQTRFSVLRLKPATFNFSHNYF